MYFAKSISAVLVGALLTTSALGSPLNVPSRGTESIVARNEAHSVRTMTKEEILRKRDDDCMEAIQDRLRRRNLQGRGDNHKIKADEYNVGSGDDTLETKGLATCFGIAGTGHYPEGSEGEFDRILGHTYADSGVAAWVLGTFNDILDDIKEAKESGLIWDRMVLVAPDPTSYTEDSWKKEEIDAYASEYAMYVSKITKESGKAPEEKKHNYKETWELKINSDKSIHCGPEGGSNQC